MLSEKKTAQRKPSKRDRAGRVLPISQLTISILEARLFLEQGVPPVPPGALHRGPMVGLLMDAVIRPSVRNMEFLGVDVDRHAVVIRNAPWMVAQSEKPSVPDDYVDMFSAPAGWIVGCLLFRYLVALTDDSTFAHRSYRNAAKGQSLIVDVDAGQSTIQVHLPREVALAIGHAVASHYILGKSVP